MSDVAGEHLLGPEREDPAYRPGKDYFDRVAIVVRFKEWAGAPDNDEAWLIETYGAAWSKDWLTEQVEDLAAAEGGGCCGRGAYFLETRDRKTEWGASGASFEILLTLAENMLSDATWAGLGVLAMHLRSKLKERSEWGVFDEKLTDEDVRETAIRAVVTLQDVEPQQLNVRSVERSANDSLLVNVQETATGRQYTVEVKNGHGSARLARIRKVTEPKVAD